MQHTRFGKFKVVYILCATCLLAICHSQQQGYAESVLASVLSLVRNGLEHVSNEPPDRMTLLREYDFIIVGAGTSGCVLANRLTEVPEWKVLLIEAGNRENYFMDIPMAANFIQFTQANWKYKTAPSKNSCMGFTNNQCNWPRGKIMGGSSVLNYMIYTRGNRRDYDKWEQMGNTGWGWENVLRYYKKVENFLIPEYNDPAYHRQGGYLDVSHPAYSSNVAKGWVKAAQELGYTLKDINGKTQVGVDFLQLSLTNGTRHSASKAYLHPIKNRPNLHVTKNSMVTKLLSKGNKIVGVQFMKGNKMYRIYSKKETIVSAGAINSPQLLMLSGIGPRKDLQKLGIPVIKDSMVGYNLMDHIAAGGITFTLDRQNLSLAFDDIFSNSDMIFEWLHYHSGPLTIPGGCEAIIFKDTEHPGDEDGWPDIELLFIGGSINGDSSFQQNFGFKTEMYNEIFEDLGNDQSFTVFPMLLRPKSKGKITLLNKNPLSHPVIYTNYLTHKKDVSRMVHAIRETLKVAEQPSLKKMGTKFYNMPMPTCIQYGYGTDEYWECWAKHYTFTIYHPSGTCKMGPKSDRTSVVSPRLKVHGVENLRVIDASIIPEIPAAHTNAPAFMIAEKGADMIKQDWGKL